MSASNLSNLLKYSSSCTILIVTNSNALIELKCPFNVIVIIEVADFTLYQKKLVSEIKMATNFKLAYLIEEKYYFYYYFDIIFP